jgi:hypothetical protein
MSNPFRPPLGAAQLQGTDFLTLILRMQKRIEMLERQVALSDLRQSWNVVTPALPLTGVDVANANSVPVTVYIGGGTVTSVRIDGITLNLPSGAFRLNPGDLIRVNYSVAPAWAWYGD